MLTVQEVQEKRHTLWLRAGIFESFNIANSTGFFPFDRIPTHFIYIHIPQNYCFYRHVTY